MTSNATCVQLLDIPTVWTAENYGDWNFRSNCLSGHAR